MNTKVDISLEKQITVPQLCCPNAEKGNIKGKCIFCGLETDAGFPIPKKSNFTKWYSLSGGNCVCPSCAEFWGTRQFRSRSWVATKKEVKFGKLTEIAPTVLNPPSPPFFIYLTRGGQKQGWLFTINLVSYSQKRFFIACDWADQPIMVEQKQAQEMFRLAAFLRKKEIGKGSLRNGNFVYKIWEKALEEGWNMKLAEARKFKKNLLWEVILHAVA